MCWSNDLMSILPQEAISFLYFLVAIVTKYNLRTIAQLFQMRYSSTQRQKDILLT